MKTKLFLQSLILAILTLSSGRIEAQTVFWERKALGQQQMTPCSGPFTFPNNNAWTQDQLILVDTGCNPDQEYLAEPSNWSTPTYPNGASVDVILGNTGGAPTNLDRGAPITVHSVTVLNVGGLSAEFGSSLTASVFDFQGDGVVPVAGGGGPNPILTLTPGGTFMKTGGNGAFVLDVGMILQVPNGGTIASSAGALRLPGNATAYAGGVNFNAAAGALIDLAPAHAVDAGAVRFTGLVSGSNTGGTVRLNEGRLTTVAGSGGTTFNFGGNTFQWQSGGIVSTAADPFINAGTLNITGAASPLNLGFTNQGTLAQSGAGAFNLPFGSRLTNVTSGTFDIRNDNGLTANGGGGPNPFLDNFGTVRKSAGTGASVIDRNIIFSNIQGTIRVDSGTLVLAAGLTRRGGTGDGGAFVVAPGATVALNDGVNETIYHGAYTGSGGGTVLLSGGGISPDVFSTGVTFDLPGAMFQWTGGYIGGYQSPVPSINAGTMTLAGSAEKQTYGNFFNSGTIIQKDTGRLGVSVPNSGGVFTNNAPAVYDLQSDAGLYSGPFNNSGLFKKSGGAGTSAVDLPFINSGIVEVLSGTIQFTQFRQTAGTTSLNGGNLAFTNEAVFDGGSLVGSGTITGSIRNNGATISPGLSPGKITVNGNYTQGAGGVLTLEIAGATPGTQYDQLQVSGTAALGGTLNVSLINGFLPAVGDTFQLLLAGSFTGTFATVNTAGFTGTVNYSGSGITITVTSVFGTPSPTPTATPSKLLNIATRMRVQTGENVLIGGFIITGTDPKQVIIRAIGPSLSAFIPGALADTTLELFQGSTLLASNDNWRVPSQNESDVLATGIPPTNDLESALVRTLQPGAYTAIVRGSSGASGIGLIEAYDLNQTANSKFANIATRGFVEAGDNVMIGGLIIGPGAGSTARVVVRAIGPSLTAFGIAGALQDPAVDLKDANGTTLSSNDDWQQGQPAELQLLGLVPTDTRESALVTTLAPGAYTAIVRGAGNTTGVGLVEVYQVQ